MNFSFRKYPIFFKYPQFGKNDWQLFQFIQFLVTEQFRRSIRQLKHRPVFRAIDSARHTRTNPDHLRHATITMAASEMPFAVSVLLTLFSFHYSCSSHRHSFRPRHQQICVVLRASLQLGASSSAARQCGSVESRKGHENASPSTMVAFINADCLLAKW